MIKADHLQPVSVEPEVTLSPIGSVDLVLFRVPTLHHMHYQCTFLRVPSPSPGKKNASTLVQSACIAPRGPLSRISLSLKNILIVDGSCEK